MGIAIGVRYGRGGQVVECNPGTDQVLTGSRVVVKTEEGLSLGVVAYQREAEDADYGGELVRLANDDDLTRSENSIKLEREAYQFCSDRVTARQMDMNLVVVERLLDGTKIIFYFTAEGRVDFRALVKDLASRFRCRVEMRQIGVRNETKIVGGLGSCGRQLCCNTFMREFTPVSVKMAKEQNLSLNPNKISGLCGRLMCCLAYEFPVYMECKKNMPKVGKPVETPAGIGKVIRQNVMSGRVSVYIDGKEHELESNQTKPAPPPAQPTKQNQGRKKSRGHK